MSESGENTDEWITQFRELLEKNQIRLGVLAVQEDGQSTRSLVSFQRGRSTGTRSSAYAKLPGGTARSRSIWRSVRRRSISTRRSRSCCENIQFSKCRVNEGI